MSLLNKNRLIFFLFISLFTYFYWQIHGKFGFIPRDEARVLGLAQRLSNGQVPHRDFMYYTWIGSGYLHYFHLFIPSMNVQFQRILAILMFQGYSLLLLNLSDKYRKLDLFSKILLFVISTVLNIHYYEFTIWPTIDGIFVITLGSYLIFKTKKYNLIGFFIIGFSPLFKTPFYASIFFIVIFSTIIIDDFNLSNFFKKSFTAGLPTILYVLYISASGGFNNLFEETFNQPSYKWELVNSWIHHLGFYEKRLIPLSIFLVLTFTYHLKNKQNLWKHSIFSLLTITLVINLLDFGSMTYKPIINLLNLFFCIVYFLKYFNNKYPDTFIAFVVCYSIEFGAMMSVGWRYGLYVSGTVLILILLSVVNFNSIIEKINNSYFASTTSLKLKKILIPTLFVTIFLVPVRDLLIFQWNYIYVDKPREELTYNLNNLNSNRYGNVYTSDTVYKYLESIEYCLDQYDTKRISIFPDNAILYFIYNLENPIPVDWLGTSVQLQTDYYPRRIKEAIDSPEFSGSIVFLQSYKVSKLPEININDINKVNNDPFPEYVQEAYRELYDYLKNREGTRIETCNSFTVLINN